MAKKLKKSDFEAIKDNKITLIDGQEVSIGSLFTADDFFPSKDEKDIYIKYEALFRVVKKVFLIDCYYPKVVHYPEKINEWCAVVEVEYHLQTSRGQIVYGAAADCRSSTADANFAKYTTALAETRAKARALRDILGLSICSVEEISDSESIMDKTLDDPIEEGQKMVIEKKIIIGRGKTLSDISIVIGRTIKVLEELSKGEAAKVINELNQ